LIESDFAAVALGNGVGGDESKVATSSDQACGIQEEIGTEIGNTFCPLGGYVK